MHPQSPPWTIGGTVQKESDDLAILGVTFDSKMTFEKHHRSVSRAASQRLGILRKCWRVLYDRSLLGRCFQGFVLPVLEYCSAVWCSAANTHLKLLDWAVSGARGRILKSFMASLTNSCFLNLAYGSIVRKMTYSKHFQHIVHSDFFRKSVRNLRRLGASLNCLRNISNNVNIGLSYI